jgi:hypothetical protein
MGNEKDRSSAEGTALVAAERQGSKVEIDTDRFSAMVPCDFRAGFEYSRGFTDRHLSGPTRGWLKLFEDPVIGEASIDRVNPPRLRNSP